MKEQNPDSRRITQIAQSIHGILWEADARTFEFTYVSPQSETILGYTPDQWYGESTFWQDRIHPDDRERAVRYCHQKSQKGESHEFEYRFTAADGRTVWLKDMVTVQDAGGEQPRLQGLMIDITDQKEAELKKDRLLQDAYELAKIGHWELDLVDNKLFWSDEIRRLHEVGPDFVPDLDNAIAFYKEGEHRDRIREAVEHAIETGDPFEEELIIVTARDNERWIRAVGEAEMAGGRCLRLYGSTQDITEQKRAEERIKHTERRLRDIVEHSTNLFYRHDTDHNLTYVSPQSRDFLGYAHDEMDERPWTEFITDHPVNRKGLEYTNRAIETGRPQPVYELQLCRTDGQILWVQVNEAPIVKDGQTVAIVGSLTDITGLKRAQEELESQKERLEESQRVGRIGDWNYDVRSGEVSWSDNLYELYERDPAKGPPTYEETQAYYPEDTKLYTRSVERCITEGIPYSIDLKGRTEKNNKRHYHVEGIATKNGEGEVVMLHGIVQDITGRKSAEEELKQRENQLKSLTNNIDGVFHRYKLNPDGSDEVLYISKGVERLYGVTAEEVLQSPERIWEQVNEEDLELLKTSIDRSAETLNQWDHKYRIRAADGTFKWIHGRGFPFRLEDGSVIWDTLQMDVTDRELAKKEREELYRMLEDGITEIYIFDTESLQFLYVNNLAAKNTGYARRQMLDMSPLNLKPEFDEAALRNLLRQLEDRNKERIYLDTTHERADGTLYPVQIHIKKDTFKGREVYIATALDITREKNMDRRLRSLLETAPLPIFIESRDGRIIDLWNDAAEQVIGFSKEEVLNQRMPHISKEQEASYYRLKERLQRGESIKAEEIVRTRKDGTPFPARVSASPLMNEKGEIDSILVTLEDITEEKELERNLKYQLAFSATSLDSLPGLFYMLDEELRIIRVNKNAQALFGFTDKQMSELDPFTIIAREDRKRVRAKIREIFETGYAETETRIVARGREYHYYINGRLLSHEGKKYILGNGIDITDRVHTEAHNEVLLQEIHHRVKNNLAIISGLLQLELDEIQIESERDQLPLQRSINRIYAMAKVHELLYKSSNFTSINIEAYLRELSGLIKATLNRGDEVQIRFKVDNMQMNVNEAIPLGMLLNELMTNSLKYAFPDEGGEVRIEVQKSDGGYRVRYSDDGQGIDGHLELEEADTLGMTIIHTLLQQLKADYRLDTDNKFELEFEFTELTRGSHSTLK